MVSVPAVLFVHAVFKGKKPNQPTTHTRKKCNQTKPHTKQTNKPEKQNKPKKSTTTLTGVSAQHTASPFPGLSQSISPLKVISLPASNIDLDVLSLTIFFKIHHLQTKFESENLISSRDNE